MTANTNCGIKFEDFCSYNNVSGNQITSNGEDGIQFYSSSDNIASGNNITNNGDDGIDFTYCHGNGVSENNIVNNSGCGIDRLDSTGNTIVHNNFSNTHQIGSTASVDVWDGGYPCGGNYWSDYSDVDLFSGPYQNETGSDCIWDHDYVINLNNVDNYPLVNPWSMNMMTVPFHYQTVDYYCGPACLEMVFDYYGEDISQLQIAEVARTHPYTTYTDELRRAAHFSDISSSGGTEMPENITGYSLRQLGYVAFEKWDMTIDQLRSMIDNNLPIILLMWYSPYHYSGHYRVAIGYNNTHVILHDPWNNAEWGGAYGGPYLAFNYSMFLDLWSYSGYWGLYTSPWNIEIDTPLNVQPGSNFTVTASITYLCPASFLPSDYISLLCNATIMLPTGLILTQGETPKKALGSISPGNSVTVNWTVEAKECGVCDIAMEAEGGIEGSVSAHDYFSGYNYEDRIGVRSKSTLEVSGHDFSNGEIILSKTLVGQGFDISMNVTVHHEGSSTIASSLIINASTGTDERIIATISGITFDTRDSVTIVFTWNTSGFPKGIYDISAYIAPAQGELHIDDNFYLNGQITIAKPGNLNGDDIIDIFDITTVALAFGSTPNDANWNPISDINNDGIVDIFDLVVVALHFGEAG